MINDNITYIFTYYNNYIELKNYNDFVFGIIILFMMVSWFPDPNY